MPVIELPDKPHLGDPLPINIDAFTLVELQAALSRLRVGKAAGPDDTPPDFWKAFRDQEDACVELLALCQRCWDEKTIPASWRLATVILLFKKGDATLPQNYRPISLLAVGYKILASIIHQRLLQGGAEQRMRSFQDDFRPGRGTADALMVVRRMVDAALQRNEEGLLLLLLDWAKAFDRITVPNMLSALRRFGLPEEFVHMIDGIYRARLFVIKDHTGTSSERWQDCGIAQGCFLSPYLFIMVQTVMLHDVFANVILEDEPDFIVTNDVLYANDYVIMACFWTLPKKNLRISDTLMIY